MLAGLAGVIQAEPFVAITDESKVPPYNLPPILDEAYDSGDATKAAWAKRRVELLNIFTEQVYGSFPKASHSISCDLVETGPSCNGKATRKQFKVLVTTAHGSLPIDLVIFYPNAASNPSPCFLSLNFTGNHTIISDPEIAVTKTWMRNDFDAGIGNNQSFAARRGTAATRCPVELLIEKDCAVATAYYGDIDPDFDDDFRNGVHALFPEHRPSAEHPDRWGSIAGWSWGLSRLLDALKSHVPEVNSDQVYVVGHSRLGKAAIWAGVTDERFAGVISNDSGCGGAALSKRIFGETVGRINDSFPHWFCRNFRRYNRNEIELPVDQHQLLALVAPRPLYVASASEDLWADPRGEFLSTSLAGELYQRFGLEGLHMKAFPEPKEAAIGLVSYHLRKGKHDINAWDWERYAEFATKHSPSR
jgi:hypothetical protein